VGHRTVASAGARLRSQAAGERCGHARRRHGPACAPRRSRVTSRDPPLRTDVASRLAGYLGSPALEP